MPLDRMRLFVWTRPQNLNPRLLVCQGELKETSPTVVWITPGVITICQVL